MGAWGCDCFEAMRELSRNGFIIDVRVGTDRDRREWHGSLPVGIALRCDDCQTRYVAVPVTQAILVAAV